MSQSNNRSILGFLSREWQKLTPLEKASWAAWAASNPRPNGFGGQRQIDAMQAYMLCMTNTIRLFGYAGYYTEAPLVEPAATVDTVVAAAGGLSGEIDVAWTHLGTGLAADVNEIQMAGPYSSVARVSVQSKYTYRDHAAGNIMLLTVTGLIPGGTYWTRVRYVDEFGQVTNFVADQCAAGV